MRDLLCRFAVHYRGRHRPEDALWWLDHPDLPGPSGARPVQEVLLAAADELGGRGQHDAAAAMLEVLGALLQSDRDAAEDALGRTGEETGSDGSCF